MQIKHYGITLGLLLVITLNCNAIDEKTDADICPTCSEAEKQDAVEKKVEQNQPDASQKDEKPAASATDSLDEKIEDDNLASHDSPDEN